MPRFRLFVAGAALLALSSGSWAQVDGPTPLAWRWAAPTSVSPSGAPTIVGETVYVAVGSRIYAMDRETGNQKWKYPIADPIDGAFRFGVVVANGMVMAAGDNNMVYAVDMTTGEGKWQSQAPSPISGPLALCGNILVAPQANNSLFAIDTANGNPAWEAPLRIFDGIQGRIGSHQTNIILFNQKSELLSINATTRKTNWRQRFASASGDVQPVVFGDNIYVSTGTFLTAVSAGTGGPRFQRNLGETLIFSPAVNASGISVVSREGTVFFLDPGGRQLTIRDAKGKSVPATIALSAGAVAPPVAIGKNYVIPTSEGSLNMYDPATLALKWSFTIRPYIAGLKVKSGANGEEKPVIAVPAAGPAVEAGNAMMVLVADGSLLSFDGTFGVDTTAPEVKMPWPVPGSQVSGVNLDLVFQIDDEATGVNDKTLVIEANGQPCTFEFGRDGIAVVRFNSFSKNPRLQNGRLSLKVKVADWLGNVRESSFSLYIDNSLKPLAKPSDKPGGAAGGGNVGGGPGRTGGGGGKGGGR